MAEVIVSSLLLKLADAVFQEAVTLYGVKDKVESVNRELIRIQCFLKDADSKSKQKGDNRVQNWVKEVREVSFMIEDAIDTFLFEVQSRSLNKQGISNILKWMGKKLMKLYSMHKLDKKINKIQGRLKEITESRARYDIKDLVGTAGGTARSINRPPVIPDIEEIDLIGFDAEKNSIIELLLDQTVSRLSVVSIVGIGGLGKTTLAEKVYQSANVKSHFDALVWLTVSQEFKPTSLLKKILEKSGQNTNLGEDEDCYINEVNKTLKEKKYLIVLDDIWADDLWTRIKIALPNINNGSRVLITSRFVDIAKAADPENVPCELRFLTEEESLNLLFKKAFAKENSHELLEVAKKFLKKCGGLPLALVVIGGLLSTKDKTLSAWNKVINTMDWHADANKCTEILASSYDDLAVHLKTCFIYFASFPEDFELNAELIIKLWVAEGFIPQDAPGTMEEIAEKYLEELAQRCMIQVSRKSSDGSITNFRIHDLLLDLAIREAKEKDFLNVFSKQDDFTSNKVALTHRATFQLGNLKGTFLDKKKSIEYTNPNIRSLFFFGKVIPFSSQFKLLRVLVIFYADFNAFPRWWNTLNGLVHLRCLVFIRCYLGELYLHINHFPNLQTLEFRDCFLFRNNWVFVGNKYLEACTS